MSGPTPEELSAAAHRGAVLDVHAAHTPDRVAVTGPGGDSTFGELAGRASALARAWRAAGLTAGDGVALACPNRAEFLEVYAAALQSGLRLTCLNWHLRADEARYILDDCGAKAVVIDPTLAEVAGAVPAGVVRIDLGDDYEHRLAGHEHVPLDDPVLGGTMLYTSGTTGRPKGVYRPTPTVSPVTNNRLYGYRPGDAHLVTGPLYHSAPIAFGWGALSLGVTTVLIDRFDAATALRLIGEHRVTHTHMVPTMFHRLLALPEDERLAADLGSLRMVIHGAAPCPVATKQAMIDWLGPIVYEYYGATEGFGTWVTPDEWVARPGTVGRPTPVGQVVVGDEHAAELPRGEVGTLWFSAPAKTRFRYFNDDGATGRAYVGERFTLGDVGWMDDEGYLFLTDRSADLVISGGVNLYPAEVDAVLQQHPAVADVATVGEPHADLGETLVAAVELNDPAAAGEPLAGELLEFCRDHLSTHKCPRRIDFVTDLPRQDNGKIYKRLLRERYREGHP